MLDSMNLSRNTTMNTPVLDFNASPPFVIRESAFVGDANLVISRINPADMATVANLTFPAFRPHLARCLSGEVHDGFESIAQVARHDGTPVGLLLAQSPAVVAANGGD
ncbi:MAG: hypothetical protein ABI606_14680, partial [Rhodoferax sp.]